MRVGNANTISTTTSGTITSGPSIPNSTFISYSDIPTISDFVSGSKKWMMDELEDGNLPLVEDWDRVKTLIDSEDEESVNLGFELLNGYRYPRGVLNKIIVIKGLNKLLKFKKF